MRVDAPADDRLATAVATIVGALTPAAVLLYGSRATGREDSESDYDLAVLVDGSAPCWEDTRQLQSSLEEALGAPVDLVILNEVSPILAMQVLREGRLLACSNPQALENFTVSSLTDYADLKIIRREAEKRLLDPHRT